MEVISWLFSIRWLWLCKVDKLMRIYVKIFWVLFVFLFCVPLSLTRAISVGMGVKLSTRVWITHKLLHHWHNYFSSISWFFWGSMSLFWIYDWMFTVSVRCKSYKDYGIYSVLSTSANRAVFQGQTHYILLLHSFYILFCNVPLALERVMWIPMYGWAMKTLSILTSSEFFYINLYVLQREASLIKGEKIVWGCKQTFKGHFDSTKYDASRERYTM